MNLKYLETPEHIKDAIDCVNQFAGYEGALSDDENFLFNYTNEDLEIFNGKCQDLGNHHLGLFKDTVVVDEMNNAGYGTATWNGLPVYANILVVEWSIDGVSWKLKNTGSDDYQWFIRSNSNTYYCKMSVFDLAAYTAFAVCTLSYMGAEVLISF